jgi:hypothetical protein
MVIDNKHLKWSDLHRNGGKKMFSLFRCRRSVLAKNRQFNRWLFHSLTCHAASWTRTGVNLTKNGIFVGPLGEVTCDGCPLKMRWTQRRRLRKIYRSHIATEALAKGDNE